MTWMLLFLTLAAMFHHRTLHGTLPVRPSPERSPPKLCENGRAYVTDPSTGHPVCLCQLDAHPAHGLQAHPALRGIRPHSSPRPQGFGELSYRTQLPAMTSLGEPTNGLLPHHIAFHPYGGMYSGMDVNGPMRKAATRETTGPLKAWLSDHKKNPYPTKAEKIMLAIITRMTLTQVSTWFANARRRLKKDNRLASGEGDGEDDSIGPDSDREGESDSVSIDVSVNMDMDIMGTALRTEGKLSSEGEADHDSFSDISDEESDIFRPVSRDKNQHGTKVPVVISPLVVSQSESTAKSPAMSPSVCTQKTIPEKTKPKIWSISHILDS
ncbi:unnamed protein product [Lymnaea stagnalis]|uniref:Homeobox domain-containing protein n=1 Tax=Lymnaea stagnalis TaxID=6523 RepID=A0AAV2HZU8_LYMST